MEEVIYAEIITRLTSAGVIAYFQAATQTEPKDIKWFEDQVEQILAADEEQNKTYPLVYPAVLIEFGETTYDRSRGPNRLQGSGTVTLHCVQEQTGTDGASGAARHDDFKLLIAWHTLLVDVLNGFRLPCSAKLVMSNVRMDHKNRPLRDDQVSFSWEAQRNTPSTVPT